MEESHRRKRLLRTAGLWGDCDSTAEREVRYMTRRTSTLRRCSYFLNSITQVDLVHVYSDKPYNPDRAIKYGLGRRPSLLASIELWRKTLSLLTFQLVGQKRDARTSLRWLGVAPQKIQSSTCISVCDFLSMNSMEKSALQRRTNGMTLDFLSLVHPEDEDELAEVR